MLRYSLAGGLHLESSGTWVTSTGPCGSLVLPTSQLYTNSYKCASGLIDGRHLSLTIVLSNSCNNALVWHTAFIIGVSGATDFTLGSG